MEDIWSDMTEFEGYLDHEIVNNSDEPGHFVVVSHWASKEDADKVRDIYSDSHNARRAEELVIEPRRRIVGYGLGT